MTNVAVQISRLPTMSVRDLREAWKEAFQEDVPVKQNREFMIQRIAHQLQVRKYGGLDDQSQQRLKAYVDEAERLNKREDGINRPLPGTILVRLYKGEEHRVQVLHRGFEYRQVQYRSLSDVAKTITGNHCSGPMFFGLVRAKKAGER
ncbi:MAG: DUF2924 domain-containing protein [Blastochloris viridis]|uniref:DUF2924 domain-containing protein n=1 Tax=Blastochloris viridis TaxID=1079 RepID=A0A6N4R5K2_BLAVI|nr:MAG: DUF2924 domain-containing protein [Blastochloris viridis]